MDSSYYNLIQLISGVLAVVAIFAGVFISCKKLNPEKYETIPVRTTVISVALILVGLLLYAVTKMCTNLTVVTEEHYELGTLYTISLGEVLKSFGFVACIPLLFRMFKPKSRKEKPDDGILDEEFQDDGIQEDSEES